MFYDIQILLEQRQAEWEQFIKDEELRKSLQNKHPAGIRKLFELFSRRQKKKGRDIPSLSNILR